MSDNDRIKEAADHCVKQFKEMGVGYTAEELYVAMSEYLSKPPELTIRQKLRSAIRKSDIWLYGREQRSEKGYYGLVDEILEVFESTKAEVRADERERLANEFYERGDIGTLPGETSVIAWLLRSEGGGGQKRRITREQLVKGEIDGQGMPIKVELPCVRIFPNRHNLEVECGENKGLEIHDPSSRRFLHAYSSGGL